MIITAAEKERLYWLLESVWHIRRCGEILHRCRDGVKLRAPAACVDCWLDNKVKSLPVLWTVGGHQANVTYLGGMLEGGRDHLWVIKKKKRTSIFSFFFFYISGRICWDAWTGRDPRRVWLLPRNNIQSSFGVVRRTRHCRPCCRLRWSCVQQSQ